MSAPRNSYYGLFIWLAAFSLILPGVVAVRAFRAVPQPYTAPEIRADVSGVDNNLWDHLLRTYVEGGLVDYDGLRRDHLFKVYLRQLSHARPELLDTDADRLALFCNAYNALVINGVIVHDIKRSVLDYRSGQTGFFDLAEHIMAGRTISLNHLEHEVMRPTYRDARVHMALVCAARSCPAIRPEAYSGSQLERQLEDQATLFANNPDQVSFDPEKNVVHLSRILDWYSDDFGGPGGYVDFLARRVKNPRLKRALLDGSVTVEFNDYDWTLNAPDEPASSRAGKRADFGSGSIPND